MNILKAKKFIPLLLIAGVPYASFPLTNSYTSNELELILAKWVPGE